MSKHPLDHPQITSSLFFPRSATQQAAPNGEWQDGTIMVEDKVALGYRFFVHQPDSPVLLYFHGNGEVASDYTGLYQLYRDWAGMSLLVVDYRGYGWSTGTPLTSKMLPDAQIVIDNLSTVLVNANVQADVPIFLKGRSLGSAPAIYLATVASDKLEGLIIESGYASAPSLFRRLGIPIADDIKDDMTLPLYNDEKMKKVDLPLLIIHGEEDNLIPVDNAKKLYSNSPHEDKRLLIITGAGHNNLIHIALTDYFSAIREFVNNNLA
jgi:pimeloyl-ACP methyl ester carboxylesterase